MTEVPEVGQLYETQKSHVIGVVVEVVPNRTGSYRLRLVTPQLETRWTTFVPEVICCEHDAHENYCECCMNQCEMCGVQ